MTPVPQFWNGTFTLQDVIVLFGLLASLVVILTFLRRNRREDAADKKIAAAEVAQQVKENFDRIMGEITKNSVVVERRVSNIEEAVKGFMPSREIVEKIAHEKANRLEIQNAQQRRIEKNTDDIVEIRVGMGKSEQKIDGIADEIHEMKALLKDHVQETGLKMDKISNDLTTIVRRAN